MTLPTPGPTTWQAAKDIVADASELAPEQREAFVVAQCADNAKLLAEVRSLLGYLDDIDGYIEQPAYMPDLTDESPPNLTGQVVGAYALGDVLGTGGMGVVYAAARADGAYQQRVAIKLLRASNHTAQEARRMVRERQLLAQLDHPNIARLLDGGTTAQGAPYLVMEYVQGEAIDTYCRAHKLTLRERVALVRGVCAAVQSAHQLLLIHRDIKPANILVTPDGTPKLLDFGIARLLEANAEDAPLDAAQVTGLVFSPRYASPEQMRVQSVTVATDVYGLGILLYELLAGTSPYERIASSKATSAAEAMIAVLQDPPRRASEVARDATANTAIDAKLLAGELDTILLKACAKLPAERYATVAALDADLARWLEGRPILALPQSLGYRFYKFVNRNRMATAATALATLAIVGGVVGTVVQKNKAELRYAQVREMANSFIFKYSKAIESMAGAKPVMKQMASDGLAFLDSLNEGADTDPALAVELGAGYAQLSTTLFNGRGLPSLGDKAGAATASQKARMLLEIALQQTPKDAKARYEMALLERDEAALLGQEGDGEKAMLTYDASVAGLEKLVKEGAPGTNAGLELPQVLLAQALVAGQLGLPGKPYIDSAEAAIDRWAGANASDPEIENLRLLVVRRQFMAAMLTNKYDEAVTYADKEILGYDAYLKNVPDNFVYGRYLQIALINKGAMLNQLKRYDESVVVLTRALAVGGGLIQMDPASVDARSGIPRSNFHRAKAYFFQDKTHDAATEFAASATAYRALEGKDLPVYVYRQQGEALWWAAKTQLTDKDVTAARRSAAELVALAAKRPETFAKAPATDWVEEAKQMVSRL